MTDSERKEGLQRVEAALNKLEQVPPDFLPEVRKLLLEIMTMFVDEAKL